MKKWLALSLRWLADWLDPPSEIIVEEFPPQHYVSRVISSKHAPARSKFIGGP